MTLICLFTCMDVVMSCQVWGLSKSFMATITCIWFFTSVDSHMLLHFSSWSAYLRRHMTLVWLFICMNVAVQRKTEWDRKYFLAKHHRFMYFLQCALSYALSFVQSLWISSDTSHMCGFSSVWMKDLFVDSTRQKIFVANLTCVWFLTSMCYHMSLKAS